VALVVPRRWREKQKEMTLLCAASRSGRKKGKKKEVERIVKSNSGHVQEEKNRGLRRKPRELADGRRERKKKRRFYSSVAVSYDEPALPFRGRKERADASVSNTLQGEKKEKRKRSFITDAANSAASLRGKGGNTCRARYPQSPI